MARGLFMGRPRAPRDTDTSNPVFKYTDALPRNDLKTLANSSTTRPRQVQQAHWDFQRPRTSDGRQQNEKVEMPGPGFDFKITIPPAEVVQSPTATEYGSEENMIGIALGSPRLVDAQSTVAQMQEKVLEPAREHPKPSNLQRKPSKWRKIGGLFKAKTAMASAASQPFYLVQARGSKEGPLPQGSSHSIDYQSRGAMSNPITNTEVWPCLEPETKPDEAKQQSATATQGPVQHDQPPAGSNLGSLLQVDIPTVELERYSVMFSALLNKNEPSPFNRCSKTLDFMGAPPPETSSHSPELPLPRRRATSPTRSNSPRLSLFPATHKSKASKVLGSQSIPRGASPLPRNQTSRPESCQENSLNEQGHVVLMVHSKTLDTSGSHKPQDSVSSFLSTTSIGSDDERLLLQKLKPVQTYVDPKGEPEWEIVSRKKSCAEEAKQKLAPTLSLNTQDLPSETASTESTSSSPILSPLAAVQQKFSPISPAESNKTGVSPSDSIRKPPGNKPNTEDTKTDELAPEPESEQDLEPDQEPEPEPAEPLPTIEISIARSVSVSKGKRQVIVPVGRRPDRLAPRARTPQVTNGQFGHRHGNSQDARIESV